MTGAERGRGQAVERLLEETPAWSGVTDDDDEALRTIERQMRRLDDFEPDEIEAGVRRYVAARSAAPEGFDVDAMSKVYVLNRYVFDAPGAAPGGRPRFAGFRGVPVRDGLVDELWPWERGEDGELRLTGYFRGYAGETYQALPELEAFKQAYGFRPRPGGR